MTDTVTARTGALHRRPPLLAPPGDGWVRPVVALALATAAAFAASLVVPLVGPMLLGLAFGVLVSNVPRLDAWAGPTWAALDKALLRCGVVLLGLRVALGDIIDLGLGIVLVAVATLTTTFVATRWIGARLGIGDEQRTLIAAGFSVCGAAAIAGVQDVVKAKPREVGLAVAMVTIFGSAMIAVVPTVAGLLDLSDAQAAVWAGASIHEVSQVVATGALLGGGTVLAVATTVKLCRVVLLAPLQIVLSVRTPRRRRGALVPWFVTGFLVMVGVRTADVLGGATLHAAGVLTTLLLCAAMVGLGRGVRGRDLWPLPGRLFLLSALATLVAAGVSLALTWVLVP